MLGAIAGDIIGSRFEFRPIKRKEFDLFAPDSVFTDDTVHTVALADSLLSGRPYAELLKEYFRRYPDAGYGGRFREWAAGKGLEPYHSFGNGSAMRVSPAAWFFDDLPAVQAAARRSAEATHNHPEGVRGAEAVAAAVFLARSGKSREEIRHFVAEAFGYDLSSTMEAIRPGYSFDVTCQGTVPAALIAFLDSTGFEDAVRNAVSLGGDSDTLACITGSIAEAFYGGVPEEIASEVFARLDPHLTRVVRTFLAAVHSRKE